MDFDVMSSKYTHVIDDMFDDERAFKKRLQKIVENTIRTSLGEIKDKWNLKTIRFVRDNKISYKEFSEAEFSILVNGEEIECMAFSENNGEMCFGYKAGDKFLEKDLSIDLGELMEFASVACAKFDLSIDAVEV